MSSYLLYGDYVILHSSLEDKNQKYEGSLSAKGFFDNKVYFQTHPPPTAKGHPNTSIITNYRDFVFQVWPLLSFEAYKQLNKIEYQKQLLKLKHGNDQANDAKIHEALDELEIDLQKCHERIKAEQEYNQKTFDQYLGYHVTYGIEVLLMHVDSRTFLSSKIITSEADKSAFKFEVSNAMGSGMVFRFLPKFKLRQIGENIQYSDQLLIKSVKLNCYINFSIENELPFDKELIKEKNAKPFKPYYKSIRTKRLDGYSNRYEAFLSQSSMIHWQIKPHGHEARTKPEMKIIKGGEIVRLRNTETSADLTATFNFLLDNSELYMRSYSGEYHMEKETVNSLFEIELEDEEYIRGSDCTFTDERSNSQTFRLRHFMTGYLLGYQETNGKKIPVLMNNYSSEQKSDKNISIFEIKFNPTVSLSRDTAFVKNYGVYHVEFKGGFYLRVDESRKFVREQYIKLENAEEDIFVPLTDKEMGLERKALELKPENSEENAFQIIRVSPEDKKLLLHLSSAVTFLTYLRDMFKHQLQDDENFGDVCKRALTMLSNLIFFMIKTEGTDPFECEGIPIQEHQKIFKDMKLLEILVDLLYFPFKSKIYDLNDLSEIPSDVIKIFILSYRLIKFSIKEYRPNELYASQWLGLLMNQTLNADPRVDIMAEPTLTELIDNNKIVLETKITPDTIKNFVNLIVKNPLKKFIKLLRAVCVCDNEPMINNQREISILAVQDKDARERIVFKLRETKDHLVEVCVKGEWILLNEFQKQKESEEYEFFLSTIELMADLCLGKNFLAIDELKEIYTFKLCSLLISNKIFDLEIRAAFVKLMNTLWVEAKGKIQQNLSSIRSWEEISAIHPIKLICIDQEIPEFDLLKSFIIEYLNTVTSAGYLKGYEKEKNTLTLEILNLLKNMTRCGFLKTIEQINSFLPSLLFILKSVHDVTDIDEDLAMASRLEKLKKKKEKMFSVNKKSAKNKTKAEVKPFITRYSENEETVILMECKEVICDILQVFFDLRTDLRVTAFMQEFRKEYEQLLQMNENNIHSQNNPEENQTLSSLFKKSKRLLKKIGIQEEEDLKQKNYDIFQYVENPIIWVNNILTKKTIEIVESAPYDIMALLLDLTLYENPNLVNKAFELLYKLNSQSKSIFDSVCEVQLLENENLVKVFKEIKEVKEELRALVDTSEVWYCTQHKDSKKNFNDTINIMNHLINLLDMKVDQAESYKGIVEPENEEIARTEDLLADILDLKNPEINETSLLLNYSVNKERQELFRNLNVAEFVILMIKYDLQLSEKEEIGGISLIKLCYKFLAGFCHNNLKNQNLIETYFEYFTKHLKKNHKNDAHLLIIELFNNNKKLLDDEEKINEIFQVFCDILEQTDNMNLKEYLMNSLQNFIKYKNASIKINQTKLISKLGSNSYKKILFLINSTETYNFLIGKIANLQTKIEESSKRNSSIIIDLPSDIGYFSQQLLILSLVSEEKNYAAESRCQVFFPLDKLRDLLENTKKMWYLRKYILFFVYNVYFETEKETNESQNVITQIIKLIIEDFEILASELNELNKVEIRTFRGITSLYNTQLDFLNISLVPSLNIIFKLNMVSPVEGVNIYKRCLDALQIIAPKVSDNRVAKTNLSILYSLLKKKNIANFDKDYQGSLGNILATKRKNTMLNFKKVYTQRTEKNERLNENISKSEKFRKRLDQTMKSEKYHSLIEEEFQNLVDNIVNIESITQKTFSNLCNIGYEKICTSLLKLIDPTDMTLSMDLTIVGLKVFRKIIERENKDIQTCAAEWSPNDFAPYSKKIEIRQNQLCDFGLVEVIGNMIGNHSLSRELKNEAILVGISMLLGGNSKVQNKFFRYMSVDDSDNRLLVNLKEMIEDDFFKIRKVMDIKNRGYLNKVLEIQAELAEIQENTVIMNPAITPGLKSENLKKMDKKSINEEEQALLEKEEEEKKGNNKKKVYEGDDEEDESEEDEIKIKVVNCSRIYLLLRLFCEGHKMEMQNHLRVQIIHKLIHGKTQNFISNSSYKFGSLVKFVNVHCTALLDQIIDFLIESVQGPCVTNQVELTKAKIVEFVKDLLSLFIRPNDYLKRGFTNSIDQENIDNLVTKSSNLLISLTEGNINDEILKDLCNRLDFRFIRQILTKEFESFMRNKLGLSPPFPSVEELNKMMKFSRYEGNIAQTFNLFLLIKTIAFNIKPSDDPDSKNAAQYALENDQDVNPLNNQAIEFFDSNVVSIEIFFQEKLQRIFFPIEPVCRNLSKETRIKLMSEVKRDSPNEKIMGLLSASSDLFNEMEHMTYLKTWKIRFTAARLSLFRNLSTLIALFLNILMLATFYRRIETDPNQTDFTSVSSVVVEGGVEGSQDGKNVNILLWSFGATQVATSGLMVIYWIVLYSELVIKRKWRELVKENKQKIINNRYEEEIEEMDSFDIGEVDSKLAQYLLFVKGPDSKFFLKNGKRYFGSNFMKFHYYIKSTVMLLSEPSLLYLIFYIVVSLFGLLLSPLFYCYHLLDIISRFETLKNVIRSVTRNANQLLLTLLLGLLILYMFSILMFYFLFDAYYNTSVLGGATVGQNLCSTMFQCYLSTVDFGFRNGGGFGDSIQQESYEWDNRGRYFLSFFIKICSFALINIIFLNIIFGIIIDTFAELRDEKSRIDEDMKNICFICGLDRYDFEKSGDGFDAHIDKDHRLWNYIYYIYYLKTKDATDHSGIESNIAQKIEQDDTSWFPLMKAMILGEGEKKVNVGDIINDKVGVLKGKLENISILYDQKLKSLNTINKKK